MWNNSPSNYLINIQDGDILFKISPIENFTQLQGFSKKDLTNFDEQYNPKVISNIIEKGEDEKLGFSDMYKNVIYWYKGLNNDLCTLGEENANRIIAT